MIQLVDFSRRSRAVYAMLIVATILTGLSTRHAEAFVPAAIASNLGDVLWAMLMYLCFAFVFPQATSVRMFIVTAISATIVECSQLYHAPWIDGIRRTTLGGLMLGYGFAFGDLLCYLAGAMLCLALEWSICRSGSSSKVP